MGWIIRAYRSLIGRPGLNRDWRPRQLGGLRGYDIGFCDMMTMSTIHNSGGGGLHINLNRGAYEHAFVLTIVHMSHQITPPFIEFAF